MKRPCLIFAFIMLLGLLPLIACAQDSFPFLAKNRNEFVSPRKDTTTEDVYINANNKVIVKTAGDKTKYDINEVWGFRNKKGKSYRIYKEKDYEVLQADTFCVYTREAQNDVQTYTGYFFSIGIGGDLYEMTDANFKNLFSETNDRFLSLLKINFNMFAGYTKYDEKNKSYKIVELYKKSLKHHKEED